MLDSPTPTIPYTHVSCYTPFVGGVHLLRRGACRLRSYMAETVFSLPLYLIDYCIGNMTVCQKNISLKILKISINLQISMLNTKSLYILFLLSGSVVN